MHAWVGTSVDQVGRTLDRFFGAASAFEQTEGSRLDVTIPLSYGAHDGLEAEVDLDARIALPRTERRWHLWLNSARNRLLTPDGLSADPNSARASGGVASTAEEETSQRRSGLGVQALFETSDTLSSLIDVGVGFVDGFRPDIHVRWESQYQWPFTDAWHARTRPTVFWSAHEGTGAGLTQIFEYFWSEKRFVRSETTAYTWHQEAVNEWTHSWTLYDQVSPTRGFAYRLGAFWDDTEQGPGLRSYGPNFRWRERIYKKWLFLETDLYARAYPGSERLQSDKGVRVKLEARFYAPDKTAP
ncbi:MAG: hypothetical protein RI556_06245 [Hydrogenovibrio sp.]|uniref:hypothetical protein n=1 Tax=Hydrogenovibrio sp. TaxID=2065821 RepID=UPI0028703508|nr:hypothetical protein [Hydrogenovibrio sp.]MDR9498758.1 hypothetical protein [Hydrogenovibrio sp.]